MPSRVRFKLQTLQRRTDTILLPKPQEEIERVVNFLREAGFNNISCTLENVNNGKTTSTKHVIIIYSTQEKFNKNIKAIKAASDMSKDLLIRCQTVCPYNLDVFSVN